MTTRCKSLTDYFGIIGNNTGILLVEFTADWSIPSNVLSQDIQDLLQSYNLNYVTVNFNDCPELFQKCKINILPCVKLLRNGQEIGQVRGNNLTAVKSLLEANIE